MAPPLLLLQDIHLTFGGTPLLTGAEISVSQGERLCLVGRNGSGKSTLLKIAAGDVHADSGTRFVQPGATVRYLPQEPDLSGFDTTLAYVEAGLGPGDAAYRALWLLEQLGLTGAENPKNLSGGEARRAALARVLAPEPDILLLDEPTNHLDLPAIEWLEGEIRSMKSALVLISHDRRFLENLSRATVWLDRGIARRLEKGFAAFEEWRDTVLEQEEIEHHKLARKIAAEDDWMRYGVTARRKRNMRRVRELSDMRKAFREHRRATGSVTITVTEGETSGKLVVEAKNLHKRFGEGADERVIVDDFSIRILRSDRIGVVGPNGAGKTTLLNMLTGDLVPDSGTVKLGANLQMAFLDQRRATLSPETTLKDALTGGGTDTVTVGGTVKHVASYMKDFLFSPDQLNTPVSVLSGGERGRLTLARALALPSNFLVLDEPTNDLDLETLDLLEEMIADYPGTVILVSHDRDFLDRTVNAVVVSEGKGHWQVYAGGYTDMLAQRGEGVTARAADTRPAAKSKPAATSTAVAETEKKRKLSYKEKHALETLPERIAALERDIAKLQNLLADPELYSREPAKFEKVNTLLARAEQDRAASEEEWLRLEMLREELEG
ncbi:ABC-F family ATP-binding cassette domain-containing protein [Pseudochelatococcus contaminans]|uniref:ATP-binding protein Uup n=1 Tax=Pseudochelatococcus contaminans TaxID=1538103 RepID=A0A7W6EHE3_9HYPH|nr:ATP-binding cassette domain-containing protein [Pseudochelatococcus contaminans]MBB3810018.1 ATP-binding cassette subfamily F protein uup [Pseudochelatococcus contaminans]